MGLMDSETALAISSLENLTVCDDLESPLEHAPPALVEDRAWLAIFREVFGHEPRLLLALREGDYAGHLPLCTIRSRLFGRYVVSLPYLNTSGLRGADSQSAAALIEQAVALARQAEARFLELRHEQAVENPLLTETVSGKVHMRLDLPESPEALMASLKSKRRSQLKNGLKRGFAVCWGKGELLPAFYEVFSRNMRDLGTPVFSRELFARILQAEALDAELGCLFDGERPIAGALLIHRSGVTEVPSASSLFAYRPTNANMAMYWHLLSRAIERGQGIFDFGRSSVDSSTHAFKKQWGALPAPANWQYHLRRGRLDVGRRDNGRYDLAISLWKRLPLPVANRLGPRIVRGIP